MKGAYAGLLVSAALLEGCHRATPSDSAVSVHPGSSGDMHVVTTLACPNAVGALRRISQAPDGRSCAYRGVRDGEDIALSLLPLGGLSPAIALQPIEASLKMDAASQPASSADVGASESTSNSDHTQIDLPGLHINAGGSHAQLRIAGMTINADGGNAHIQTGGGSHAVIDAHPGGAEIRAGHTNARGADYTLVLASATPGPHGDKAVGYIARGPVVGPLVVATFRSKAGRYDGEDTDLKRLVDLNVRG